MGLLGKIGAQFGFARPEAQQANYNIGDPQYNAAMDDITASISELQAAGGSLSPQRKKLEAQILSQLAELDDNAAQRKQYFMEDMARGFGADVQNLARARGGTGTMAQTMMPSGQMYDAQARQRSRGLLDLKGQALQDLSSLGGLYGNLYGQDMNKAGSIANQRAKQAGMRIGQQNLLVGGAEKTADNEWNRQQEQYNRMWNTLTGGAKAYGASKGWGAGTAGKGSVPI